MLYLASHPLKVVSVGYFAPFAVRLRVRHLVQDAEVHDLTFVAGPSAALGALASERLALRLLGTLLDLG